MKTYHEGVIERGENVSNAKDMLSLPHSGAEGDILLLLGSDFLLSRLHITTNTHIRVTVGAALVSSSSRGYENSAG